MENLIKKILREDVSIETDTLNVLDITAEYLIQRIPFLREYRLVDQNEKYMHFNKGKYNKDVKRIIFPLYNIFSDLHYYNDTGAQRFSRGTIGFNLINKAIVVPEREEAGGFNITARVLTMATAKVIENTSVYYSETQGVTIDSNMTINTEKFDHIINQINAAFFKLEEASKNLNFNLFSE